MAKSKISAVVTRDPNARGIYVWMLPEGQPLADEDGNVMNIETRMGQYDIQAQKHLADAAKYYGFPDGRAVFMEKRRVTEEELAVQEQRLKMGLVPDPKSPEAIREARYFVNGGQ